MVSDFMKTKKTILIISLLMASTLFFMIPTSTSSVGYLDTVDVVVLFELDFKVNLEGINIKYVYENLNGFAGEIPCFLYNILEHSPYVSSIQIDKTISICQDTLDWGVDDIDAEVVWGGSEDATDVVEGNVAGEGCKIVIIDTGIDYTHPDLDDNYMGGYDFVDNDADPKDGNGHGTHCAGIVAAEDNGIGIIGVAPKAELYSVRALNDWGQGDISDIVAGIDWAIDNGMDVISMSLGASSGDTSLEEACNRAYNAGIVVVAASGNDGKEAISYPAKYSSVIAVGATDSSRNIASFSNYGAELEVVAPGVDVYSTMPTYFVTLNYWFFGGKSQNYDIMSGTSMACPMAAGVVTLIRSANPELSASEVSDILSSTATDLGSTGWDITFGHGLVDSVAAVDEAGGGTPVDPPAKVTELTATTLSISEIELNWDANTEPDINHYNIYRDGSKIDETTVIQYLDSGLQSGTTYTYEVSAVDDNNEEGEKSASASATTEGTQENTMYVNAIDMWYEPVYWWIFIIGYDVYTKVTVFDESGNPLAGVTVYLSMNLPGDIPATGSADTGSDGSVTFVYESGPSGTYTSTITNLVKTDYTYESSMNVETSESLTT